MGQSFRPESERPLHREVREQPIGLYSLLRSGELQRIHGPQGAKPPDLSMLDGHRLPWEFLLAGNFELFKRVPGAFAGLSAAD
jgi:hypothetical protein